MRDAEDERVADAGVSAQTVGDLRRVDLLAACVDAFAGPAEQEETLVIEQADVVTGQQVAVPGVVNKPVCRESSGRVQAGGVRPADPDGAGVTGPSGLVGGEDTGVAAKHELAGRRHIACRGHAEPEAGGLGGAEGLQQSNLREVLQQPALDLNGPRHT
ncbi:hypothetical protein ACFYPX_29270 [Micromonospora zamorensis]|uniref:hypothetical protein n=1 Tax=Micromonospora zamorensis TaxID=709883 RepID=UPI0036A102E8